MKRRQDNVVADEDESEADATQMRIRGGDLGARRDEEALLERLRSSIVGGRGVRVESPFFPDGNELIYADWTASGRALATVEDLIARRVLPTYANVHTSASAAGRQSSAYRNEARDIIQLAVNAHRTKDVVLFCSTGVTGCVNKAVRILGLDRRRAAGKTVVVFVGPYEHHSNLLPWRESCAEVVRIPEAADGRGGIDLLQLERALRECASHAELMIGSFAAASNVTGIMEDVDAVTALLHTHGALAFWDYATAGPYVKIDMNPVVSEESGEVDDRRAFLHKDAIFLSPHKFLGGVGSPGVLVMKKSLFTKRVPAGCAGGGTVYFVTGENHRYLNSTVDREEGGTPDVVGAIRAGLAFQLKTRTVGLDVIREREEAMMRRASEFFRERGALVLVGPSLLSPDDVDDPAAKRRRRRRLPLFSFVVRHARTGKLLHHNFVAKALNDVFGIQSRSGCMCAGPYVQQLLGMGDREVEAVERTLVESTHECEQVRPGLVRFSLPYFISREEADFVLEAVNAVAEGAWRLLPFYRFDRRTGEWAHRTGFGKFPERVWLSDFDLLSSPSSEVSSSFVPLSFSERLRRGVELMSSPPLDVLKRMDSSSGSSRRLMMDAAADSNNNLMGEDWDEVRSWFLTPGEAKEFLFASTTSASSPASSRRSIIIHPERHPELVKQDNERFAVISFSSLLSSSSRDGAVEKDETISESKTPVAESSEIPLCFIPRKVSTKRELKQPKSIGNGEISGDAQVGEVAEVVSTRTKEMLSASLFPRIPQSIMRPTQRACKDWSMINEGDRLLLGLSGGKDSLCLLHVLLQLQKAVPFRFELAACTVDPGTAAFDPSPLIPYMKSLGVPYHYERTDIFETARAKLPDGSASYCAFCARMKRGVLYRVAREHNYNVLVLAQHLDDLAESFLMSAMRNGLLRTMKANYFESEGGVRVIRPFAYLRESETKRFSFQARLPVINENCPACFSAPGERARVKRLLDEEEASVPNLFDSLRRALVPLMDEGVLEAIKAASDRVDARGEEAHRMRAERRVDPVAEEVKRRYWESALADVKTKRKQHQQQDEVVVEDDDVLGGLGEVL